MGTRHLIAVQLDGQYRVAQYGQWDGYPSGQGLGVLNFLRKMDRPLFGSKLRAASYFTQAELEGLGDRWLETHRYLSRDTGSDILAIVQDAPAGIKLKNSIDFAGDSLFCEWAYVIDLDKNTLEIFKGFNKEPLAGERFADATRDNPDYKPVKWVHTLYLDMLPTNEFFERLLEPQEEETE